MSTDQQSTTAHDLFFRRFGTGPTLVLLHGLGVSGEMFQPIWDRLAAHHHLLIPDLRGMGHSAHLPGPFSVEQLAADVASVLRSERLVPADVIGVSQGGAVAQQLAWQYPTHIRRLVLVCTYTYNLTSPRERIEARLTPWLIRLLGPAGLAKLVLRPGVFGGARLAPAQLRLLQRLMAASRPDALLAAYAAMARFDSRPWLHQIQPPTLIVSGAQDRAVPAWHAQELARGISGAELHQFPGAGHLLIYTHAQPFIHLLDTWLATPADPVTPSTPGPIT